MGLDLDDFKQKLVAHAKTMAVHIGKPLGEAATNIALVQPFLVFLGYDILNPDEVAPEHHADFSDQYKNKVDYAIIRSGNPVIAIESKEARQCSKRPPWPVEKLFQRVANREARHPHRWHSL